MASKFKMDILYTLKLKTFSVKLSSELSQYLDDANLREPSNATENGVISDVKTMIKDYQKAKTVEKKIIAYYINWGSENIEQHISNWRNDRKRKEARISLEFKVLLERKVVKNRLYYEEPREVMGRTFENKVDVDDDLFTIIDWTQEREDFFTVMYKGMEDMMRKMKKFCGTEKKMLASIANKQQLLSGGKK